MAESKSMTNVASSPVPAWVPKMVICPESLHSHLSDEKIYD